MELNQTLHTQITANTNILSNSNGATPLKTSSSTTSTPTVALRSGEFIQGEVVDLRPNEISIKLENSDQIVTAKLEGNNELTIGQTAKFQVTASSSDQLTLKYIPNTINTQQDTTIEKALDAAGLPKNDRNKTIVSELLNHRMPIDKNTLQALVKHSLINRDASLQTLVLMQKHHIPMTKENVMQFEAYQNNENSILNEIDTLTKNMVDFLKLQGSNTLIENAGYNFTNTSEVHQNLLDILLQKPELVPETQVTITNTAASKENFLMLIKSLEHSSPSNPNITESNNFLANLYNQISNGTISLSEAYTVLSDAFPITLGFSDTTNISANPSTYEAVNASKFEEVIMPSNLSDNSRAQLIEELKSQIYSLRHDNGELGTILNSGERAALLELIQTLPHLDDLKNQLLKGTASMSETLSLIKDNLSALSDVELQKLLQAPEYSKLLEEAFHHKWTLTPSELSKENAVEKLYQNLSEDLDKLTELARSNAATLQTTGITEHADNLQKNINFMKTLNEIFNYIQLPLQLKEQEAHGDLYVFTKKNALRDNQDNLNVLLHLDMSNLGPTDIHINLQKNVIHAHFYLEDTSARDLITENLPSIINALSKKGYTFFGDVKDTYKKLDFSKDFIEQDTPDTSVTRYTFDIRT